MALRRTAVALAEATADSVEHTLKGAVEDTLQHRIGEQRLRYKLVDKGELKYQIADKGERFYKRAGSPEQYKLNPQEELEYNGADSSEHAAIWGKKAVAEDPIYGHPIHLYRSVLRRSHILARRWEDPHIYYLYRMVAKDYAAKAGNKPIAKPDWDCRSQITKVDLERAVYLSARQKGISKHVQRMEKVDIGRRGFIKIQAIDQSEPWMRKFDKVVDLRDAQKEIRKAEKALQNQMVHQQTKEELRIDQEKFDRSGTLPKRMRSRKEADKLKEAAVATDKQMRAFKELRAIDRFLKKVVWGATNPTHRMLRDTYARSGHLRGTLVRSLVPRMNLPNYSGPVSGSILFVIQNKILMPSPLPSRIPTDWTPIPLAHKGIETMPPSRRKKRIKMMHQALRARLLLMRLPLSDGVVRSIQDRMLRWGIDQEDFEKTGRYEPEPTKPERPRTRTYTERQLAQGNIRLPEKTEEELEAEEGLEVGPFHPDSPKFPRARRRALGMLLGQTPVLGKNPPTIEGPALLASMQPIVKEQQATANDDEARPHLRAPPPFTPLYGTTARYVTSGLFKTLLSWFERIDARAAVEHAAEDARRQAEKEAKRALKAQYAAKRNEGQNLPVIKAGKVAVAAEEADEVADEVEEAGEENEEVEENEEADEEGERDDGEANIAFPEAAEEAEERSDPAKDDTPLSSSLSPDQDLELYYSPLALRIPPVGKWLPPGLTTARLNSSRFVALEEVFWVREGTTKQMTTIKKGGGEEWDGAGDRSGIVKRKRGIFKKGGKTGFITDHKGGEDLSRAHEL